MIFNNIFKILLAETDYKLYLYYLISSQVVTFKFYNNTKSIEINKNRYLIAIYFSHMLISKKLFPADIYLNIVYLYDLTFKNQILWMYIILPGIRLLCIVF